MMLPNGWKKMKLGQIMSFKNGLNFSQVSNGKELNFLGVSNFKSRKFISSEAQLDKIYLADFPNDDYLLKKDDLVFVRSNGSKDLVGRCVKMNESFSKTTFSGFCIRRRLSSSETTADYILHFIECGFLKDKLRRESRGTNISNLNQDILDDFDIMLPPIEEQKKIAATLLVWDSAIEKMEKLIEAKESLLTEYGKELFGRTEQKQNENWSTIALSEVLNEHGHKSTGEEEVFSVSVHKGLVNQIEHLGRSFAAKDTSNYNRVHYGDIVYTKSPTGDFPLGIVKQSLIKEDVIVSPLYGVFTPQTFELGVILDFYFSSPINANNYLRPVAQKGAKNTINITNKKFLSAKLRLPIDVKEQKKIAQFVQTTKKEMAVLQDILENYKKQKQGLMQKLLTGQGRVK
jgi:type I restriction enzyme S subunit